MADVAGTTPTHAFATSASSQIITAGHTKALRTTLWRYELRKKSLTHDCESKCGEQNLKYSFNSSMGFYAQLAKAHWGGGGKMALPSVSLFTAMRGG